MQEPFLPMVPGVEFIDSTIEALEAALDDRVAALFVEPIKGEAGVIELPEGYLQAARALTERARRAADHRRDPDRRRAHRRVVRASSTPASRPTRSRVAKGIGGGFPIGALITFGHASELFYPGTHGSTFGGNAARHRRRRRRPRRDRGRRPRRERRRARCAAARGRSPRSTRRWSPGAAAVVC